MGHSGTQNIRRLLGDLENLRPTATKNRRGPNLTRWSSTAQAVPETTF